MAAFMHRLADNRVVDAGAVDGFVADELRAAAAGGRYWTPINPIQLRHLVWTELGALQVAVPAGGGVVSLTSLIALDAPIGTVGGYVIVEQTIDSSCSTPNRIVSSTISDVYSAEFETVTLASAGAITAGNHTIRTCAHAGLINSWETIEVTESQISAIWTPATMGGAAFAVAGADTGQESSLEREVKQRVAAARAEIGAGSGG